MITYIVSNPGLYGKELIIIKPEIIETKSLYGNLWKYYLKSDVDTNIVSEIRYEPLIISLKVNSLSTNQIDGIKSFLPELIEKNYSIKVDSIQYLVREHTIEFYPIYAQQNMYVHPNMYVHIDLDKYKNYTYITNDNLLPYVVSNNNINIDLKNIDGMYSIHNDDVTPWKDYILGQIYNLRVNGFITLESNDTSIKSAYLELASMWDAEIKRTEPVIILKTNINFVSTAENWYLINAKRIVNGKLPKYHITCKIEDPIKLQYVAIMSYTKLIEKYKLLQDELNSVKLISDNIIEATFINYQQVKEYIELFSNFVGIQDLNVTQISSNDEYIQLSKKIEENLGEYVLFTHDQGYYVVSETKVDEDSISQPEVNKVISQPEVFNLNLPFISSRVSQDLEFKIEDVDIYTDILNINNEEIISTKLRIPQDKFLCSSQSSDYLSKKEILSYHRELMVQNINNKINLDYVDFTVYEGNPISDEQINTMWTQGKFMNDWQLNLYLQTSKFSRLPYTYYSNS
jgi:hypothetical protein